MLKSLVLQKVILMRGLLWKVWICVQPLSLLLVFPGDSSSVHILASSMGTSSEPTFCAVLWELLTSTTKHTFLYFTICLRYLIIGWKTEQHVQSTTLNVRSLLPVSIVLVNLVSKIVIISLHLSKISIMGEMKHFKGEPLSSQCQTTE